MASLTLLTAEASRACSASAPSVCATAGSSSLSIANTNGSALVTSGSDTTITSGSAWSLSEDNVAFAASTVSFKPKTCATAKRTLSAVSVMFRYCSIFAEDGILRFLLLERRSFRLLRWRLLRSRPWRPLFFTPSSLRALSSASTCACSPSAWTFTSSTRFSAGWWRLRSLRLLLRRRLLPFCSAWFSDGISASAATSWTFTSSTVSSTRLRSLLRSSRRLLRLRLRRVSLRSSLRLSFDLFSSNLLSAASAFTSRTSTLLPSFLLLRRGFWRRLFERRVLFWLRLVVVRFSTGSWATAAGAGSPPKMRFNQALKLSHQEAFFSGATVGAGWVWRTPLTAGSGREALAFSLPKGLADSSSSGSATRL